MHSKRAHLLTNSLPAHAKSYMLKGLMRPPGLISERRRVMLTGHLPDNGKWQPLKPPHSGTEQNH